MRNFERMARTWKFRKDMNDDRGLAFSRLAWWYLWRLVILACRWMSLCAFDSGVNGQARHSMFGKR